MAEQTKSNNKNEMDDDIPENDTQGKEIYTYSAPWTVYAMGWAHRYVNSSILGIIVRLTNSS